MIPDPEPKPNWKEQPERQLSNDELMRAMGSKTGGWDAFPPDQYEFFMESKDRKQRCLAIIRSQTLGKDHKSPYMTDERGNAVGLAGFAERVGLLPSHASEVLHELEEDGLIRLENRGKGGLRIFLCADVPLPSERKKREKHKEKISSFPCMGKLADYQRKVFDDLPLNVKQMADAKLMAVEEWADDIEAEVMAAARLKTNAKREQVYLEFGIPIRKLESVPNKREKPARCAVQIKLFDVPTPDFVQGNQENEESVQTAETTLYSASGDAVQTFGADPSFMYSDADIRESAAAAVSVSEEPAAAAASPDPSLNPTPEPEPLAPLLEAFAGYVITDNEARRLLRDCENATVEEVGAKAGELVRTINPKAPNPGAIVNSIRTRQLPEFFRSPAAVAMWRRDRAAPPLVPAEEEAETILAELRLQYREAGKEKRADMRELYPDIEFEEDGS